MSSGVLRFTETPDGEIQFIYDRWGVRSVVAKYKINGGPAIEVDHVTLRRALVDHGHLERSADGAAYQVGFPARPIAFDLEIDELR